MASGAVLQKFRQAYQRADRSLQEWDGLHSAARRTLATCINIVLRLPVLQDVSSYGGSQVLLDAQPELLGKQMQSFEDRMRRLQQLTSELRGISHSVTKLASEGVRILREARVALDSSVARQQIGASPSLLECVKGLQSLSKMLEDECKLQAVLVSEVRIDAEAADLSAVQQLFSDQPNIRRGEWQDILLRVGLTAPERV